MPWTDESGNCQFAVATPPNGKTPKEEEEEEEEDCRIIQQVSNAIDSYVLPVTIYLFVHVC